MKRFAALIALLVLLLLIPMPPAGRALNSVGNMLHAPLFAGLSFFLFRLLHGGYLKSTLGAAVSAWIPATVFAASTEMMQLVTGRTPSGSDLLADICGVSTGILVAIALASSKRGWQIALLAAALLALVAATIGPLGVLIDVVRQRSEMPMLASFERGREISRWIAKESQIERVAQHATSGAWSLRMDLQPGTYPGASLPDPPRDWSGFDELVIDLWLAGSDPLRLVVKVTDQDHNQQHEDRFQRAFTLRPGANGIRVPLIDIEAAPRLRRLDLQRVATLSFFTVRLRTPRTLYVDNVHLR